MSRTITETELRQLVADGKTHVQIAQQLGRHPTSVAITCAVLGVTRGTKARHGSGGHDLDAYVADLAKGLSLRELGEKHGRQPNTIRAALLTAGRPTSARALLRAQAAS